MQSLGHGDLIESSAEIIYLQKKRLARRHKTITNFMCI